MGLDFFGGGVIPAEETKTMEKLAVVLDGYDSVEVVPSLFVLMGNFCSRPCNLAFDSFEELRPF
nr:unnamed protein product [Digitaria exilis]